MASSKQGTIRMPEDHFMNIADTEPNSENPELLVGETGNVTEKLTDTDFFNDFEDDFDEDDVRKPV